MALTITPLGTWDPMTPTEVAGLFLDCGRRWWLAGGYAIELAAGRPLREHADIDVLLLRRDQLTVQRVLAGWQWWAADPPGVLRPWRQGELLPAEVHDIWCRPSAASPWRIQIMLDESAGDMWTSRRDPRVRRPIIDIGRTSEEGIPFLCPEIQLFYKARNPRDKDHADLTAALPLLGARQRDWLSEAIRRAHGEHPWLRLINPGTTPAPPPPRASP